MSIILFQLIEKNIVSIGKSILSLNVFVEFRIKIIIIRTKIKLVFFTTAIYCLEYCREMFVFCIHHNEIYLQFW